MKKTFFPQEFVKKYEQLLGKEASIFFECIKQKEPKSIWVNTNKGSVEEIIKKISKNIVLEKYLFSNQAFEIKYNKPGELLEFENGEISIQEKASMLPVIALNPTKQDFVLDACASPGMKTIQLSNLSKKVLAVDVNTKRTSTLIKNKNKFGLNNVTIQRIDVRNIKQKFSKILLDAPCSSEGLVRKKRDALKNWSQKLVEEKAKTQKELLLHCFDLLEENGELVYSTCSFSPEENEEVIQHLLKKRSNAKTIPIRLKGIKTRKNELCENCLRLWPQDNNTQQFFLTKIRKLETLISPSENKTLLSVELKKNKVKK